MDININENTMHTKSQTKKQQQQQKTILSDTKTVVKTQYRQTHKL